MPARALGRESKKTSFLNPEILIKSFLQLGRFAFRSVSKKGISKYRACESRTANLCVVRISLELARSEWRGRKRSVGKLDRIPGVFPALILETRAGPTFVFDISISVPVSITIDPFESSTHGTLGVWIEAKNRKVDAIRGKVRAVRWKFETRPNRGYWGVEQPVRPFD